MRSVDHGVRKERAHSDKYCGHLAVGKMTSVSGQRNSQKREYRQHASFRCDEEVSKRRLRQLALNHEDEASGTCLHCFMSTEHQTELVSLMYELL